MRPKPVTATFSVQCLLGSLYLFVFSLPFEYWDPFGIANVFSVSKMAGLVFAVAFVANYSRFQITKNGAIDLFLLSLLWLLSLVRCSSFIEGLDLSFLQCIIMFAMLTQVFTAYPEVRKKSILYLLAGVILMILLLCAGIGEEYVGEKDINGRLTFFGTSSNMIGFWGAWGCAVVFYLLLNTPASWMKKIGLAAIFPFFFYAINESGSRGGFMLVFLSLAVGVLFLPGSLWRRGLTLAAGAGLGAVYFATLSENSVLYQRLMLFVNSQDMAYRDTIWGVALEQWKQMPIFGVGADAYYDAITEVLGEPMDTHNLFLWYLATGGVVSLAVLLLFLWRQGRRLWQAEPRDALAIIFMFMCLFMFMKSGGIKIQKVMWLLMAYVATCANRRRMPARTGGETTA